MRTIPFLAELNADYRFTRHLFIFEWTSGTKRWTDCDQDVYYGGNWYYSRDIKFERINSSMSGIDNINVEVDDTDQTIKTIILAESIKNKPFYLYLIALDQGVQVLNTPYLLFYGFCDEAARPIGSQRFQIEVYNEMIKWKVKTPRFVCSPTCQWEFKKCADKVLGTDANTYTCILDCVTDGDLVWGNRPITGPNWATYYTLAGAAGVAWVEGVWHLSGTCRYAGASTWCDKSWERCAALAGGSNTINFDGCRWLPGIQGKEILWGRNRVKP